MKTRYEIRTPYGTFYATSRTGHDVFMATPASSLDGGKYDAFAPWAFEGSYAIGFCDREIEVKDVQSRPMPQLPLI